MLLPNIAATAYPRTRNRSSDEEDGFRQHLVLHERLARSHATFPSLERHNRVECVEIGRDEVAEIEKVAGVDGRGFRVGRGVRVRGLFDGERGLGEDAGLCGRSGRDEELRRCEGRRAREGGVGQAGGQRRNRRQRRGADDAGSGEDPGRPVDDGEGRRGSGHTHGIGDSRELRRERAVGRDGGRGHRAG